MRVLVFCASSESCDPVYHEVAARVGEVLADASMSIVYGGGVLGSMGKLANAALERGAEVLGIQPRFMTELGWTHPGITRLISVESMQERKRMMIEMADAVVTLAGGSGTLEELFEAITAKRLGHFLGPIVIVNSNGFFDPLFTQLDRCVEGRFMDARHRDIWQVIDTPEEIPGAFEHAPAWPENALDFASV